MPDTDEELFQLNQFPLLDIAEALKNCTQELLAEMLTLMVEELPKDLEQMKKAFTAKDYSLVDKLPTK